MVLSSVSNESIADVARAAPGGLRWMQMYLTKNRKITEYMISEAEKANYRAIVVTVDLPIDPKYTFFSRFSTSPRYLTDPEMRYFRHQMGGSDTYFFSDLKKLVPK